MLLTPQNLHQYQRECILHMLYNDDSMLWLTMGLGKEQPDSEPVLTPRGWVPIGNLSPGDHVIGSDGHPTLVQSVHPQGVKPVLKIVFNDGSYAHCGWDHLWPVRTASDKAHGRPYRIMTTRELVESGLHSGPNRKWSVPLVSPVDHPDSTFSIEPYLMGVLLGDGNVGEYDVTICTDVEVITRCGLEPYASHETCGHVAYARVKGVKQTLRDLDLMGKRSWEKHIPPEYFLGSIQQRLSLLQGLLDTDGSPITCGGGIEFSSTSEKLADGVVELTQSLGGVARKSKSRITQHQGGDGRPSWRVNVKLPVEFDPFRLTRKLKKWVRPTKYQATRYIDRIEDTGRCESSRCIRVDAPDHLYVTRHHVVTHNTPITLTTIVDRQRAGLVKKVLVFGPLRVIQSVWHREAAKWSHTRHLRFSIMHGTRDQRLRALFANADVYLCNYENMNWLAEILDHYYLAQGKPLPFDMVVYDEVSKLKNSTTRRMAGGNRVVTDQWGFDRKVKITGWRRLIDEFKYRVGLTGTPASNGYIDLHGQYLAVDGGVRLGPYITHYRDSYFTSDFNGWKYSPTEKGKELIEQKISDITIKMDSKDYLDMPETKVTNIMVDMPPRAMKAYREVEKDLFTTLDSGREIELFSKTSVSNKCLQFCLAEGTEVLTDSGWKPIEEFEQGDRVWDGVEWASVYSLAFQGVKKVVECDGVWMTPDHKVLTVSGWVEAEDIVNGDASGRFNRAEVRLPDSFETCRFDSDKKQKSYVVSAMHLWKRICSHRHKPSQSKQAGREVMRMSSRRDDTISDSLSRDDENSTIRDVDKHAFALQESKRQGLLQLRGAWDRCMRPMVRFVRRVLEGYGSDLQRSLIHRASGQQWQLSPGQLSLGNNEKAGEQQTEQHLYQHTAGENDGDSSGASLQIERRDYIRQDKERSARGRVDRPIEKEEKTYDLINAGKRNRFTVRGATGEVFIVHNCNGSPYYSVESQEFDTLHDAKLDALEDVLEEAAGEPVLCSYTFKSDAKRIMERFKKYKPVNLTDAPSKDTEKIIDNWNAGKIRLMVGHPASMGHGIDGLQDSGHILVWFGMNWSLELYDQMNGRLDRQGQKSPVSIIRILCNDTIDLAVADAIERKTDSQEGLKNAIHRYRHGVTTNNLEVNFY